jgi:hypothetical protein
LPKKKASPALLRFFASHSNPFDSFKECHVLADIQSVSKLPGSKDPVEALCWWALFCEWRKKKTTCLKRWQGTPEGSLFLAGDLSW